MEDRKAVRQVCRAHGFDFNDIFAKGYGETGQVNRVQINLRPRAQVFAYIRRAFRWSYPRIAASVGMNHSSVVETLQRNGLHIPAHSRPESPPKLFRPVVVRPPSGVEALRCR